MVRAYVVSSGMNLFADQIIIEEESNPTIIFIILGGMAIAVVGTVIFMRLRTKMRVR
jgi:uncharacterized membrane protein YidH (DUF202 family)